LPDAHPQNLVVVKKMATPMYAKAAENSRVVFQAAADDEFEFLDGDTEWIHVRISGDSRGYLLRSSVDVPEKIAARLESPAAASGRKIHRVPGGAGRNEHVSRRLGGIERENSQDLYDAAGVAESEGIWAGGTAELFTGALSEGIEGSGGSESGAGGNRGDFRFGGRRDRESHVGVDPENGEGRGFRGKRFARRVIWIRWRRFEGLGIRDAGAKSFHHRGHRGNPQFEEGR
jgi:hypothetical protein